ncbi:MAG TPA: hypothetical protein VIY90_02650 [Steroidobacteraceae bacterium]
MSSSFPEGGRPSRAAVVLGCAYLLAAASAPAAEVYYQPLFSLTGGWDNNIELAPVASQRVSTSSAIADVGTVIGIATPTSQTTIRPDVRYEYYASASDLDRLEASLDLNSKLRYERDQLTVWGRFDRRDDLDAEAPGAAYNSVTPGLPISQGSGQINTSLVRDDTLLLPTYTHDLTPRAEVGISANFENASFSPEDLFHENFTYLQARPFYGYNYDPRTTITFGVLGSTFEARGTDSHSNAAGADAQLSHFWSPVFQSGLTVEYQKTRIDAGVPSFVNQTANDWGAMLSTGYKGLTNQFQMNVGRQILPSSAGAIYNTDQAHAQWDHEVTQRLKFTGAVLYMRTLNLIAAGPNNNTRTYATGLASLQWMMTPVWYIAGRYSIGYQRYQLFGGGLDNGVSIQIGYRGLGRQTE